MRPLSIELSAFGPFPSKLSLDLTQLNQQGLFLVTGPTGSGKSTIFDALTYALYEKTSSDGRDSKTIRSDFAKDETTYVKLDFDHLGKYYQIIRQPQQELYDADKKRMVKHDPKVEFFADGESLTAPTKTATNETIAQQLGMTYHQFSQIVLLAQGKFQDFLLSNSSEKEVIFREIFNTAIYKAFELELTEKRKGLEAESKNLQTRLDQILSQIEIAEEDSDLLQAMDKGQVGDVLEGLDQWLVNDGVLIDELKTTGQSLDEEKEHLKKGLTLLDKDRSLKEESQALDKMKEKMTQVDQQLTSHRQAEQVLLLDKDRQEKAKKYDQLQEEVKIQEAEKSKQEQALEEMKELYRLIKADYEQLDQEREDLSQLKSDRDVFLQVEKLESQLSDVEKQAEFYDEDLKNKISLQKELEESMKTLSDQKEEGLQAQTRLDELEGDLDKNKEEKEEVRAQLDQVAAYKKEEERLGPLLAHYQDLESSFQEKNKAHAEKSRHYRQNLAGLLAQDLESDAPCPVCGSTDHPQPASLEEGAINQEDVEKAEEDRRQAELEVQAANFKLSQAREAARAILKSLSIQETQVKNFEESLIQDMTRIEDQVRSQEKKAQALKEQVQKVRGLESKLEKTQLDFHQAETDQARAQVMYEEKQTQASDLKDQLEENEGKLPLADKTQLENQIIEKEKWIKQVTSDYQMRSQAVQELDREVTRLSSAIETGQANRLDRQADYDQALARFREALNQQNWSEDSYQDLLLQENQAQDLQAALDDYQRRLTILDQARIDHQTHIKDYGDLKDRASYEEGLDQVSKEQAHLQDQLVEVTSRWKTHGKIQDQLKDYQASHEDVLDQYHLYRDLEDVATGKAAETGNVSFERYVLGIYMDEILYEANQIFEEITEGQFKMIRQEEASDKRGMKGLEIDIFDAYTGQLRSVKTLSGGETFMASLSLAVGMSEVIQHQAGGISVDMLFIDEGFGSLDSHSLDLAIEALSKLNATGRFIGIISHVEELKTRIPAQIQVTKSAEGSSAQIVL